MKQLIIIAWACWLIGSARAQDRNKTQLGFLGGINFCHAGYEDYENDIKYYLAALVLYHGGVQVDIPMTRHVSILTELTFNRLGVRDLLENYGAFGMVQLEQRVSYIELPIMAKLNVKGFGIYAGPKIGALVAAKNSGQYAVNGLKWENARQEYTPLMFSAVGGIEYTHTSGIGIYARATTALHDVQTDKGHSGPTPYNHLTLRAYQIGIHYRLWKI